MEEGLDETLIVDRLGVGELLWRGLATTNPIESCLSISCTGSATEDSGASKVDIMGLYLNPSHHAMVLCVDEKSKMQAPQCWPRHRGVEFRKFLNQIDRPVSANLTVHVVLDNYATHKTKEIQARFPRHPRYHLHFTPHTVRA